MFIHFRVASAAMLFVCKLALLGCQLFCTVCHRRQGHTPTPAAWLHPCEGSSTGPINTLCSTSPAWLDDTLPLTVLAYQLLMYQDG